MESRESVRQREERSTIPHPDSQVNRLCISPDKRECDDDQEPRPINVMKDNVRRAKGSGEYMEDRSRKGGRQTTHGCWRLGRARLVLVLTDLLC